jgi:uncharacterized SAM-binding protein YcdF (DUF218 family)
MRGKKLLVGSIKWSTILLFILLLFLYLTRNSWLDEMGVKLVVSDDAVTSDAIILLGGEGSSLERSKKAAELFKSGYAKKVLLTDGSFGYDHKMEIEKLTSRVEALGVPRTSILLEDQSQNTFENAKFSKQILTKEGIKNALVVTSDWHTLRTKLTFEKVYRNSGVQLRFIAAPSDNHLKHWWTDHSTKENVPMEWLKIVYYKLLNRA